MCNDYRLEVDIASIAEDFENLEINFDMPEGVPNVETREDIQITDIAPIVRSSEGSKLGELVTRRCSWPGPTGKPSYHFHSARRDSSSHRLLVLCEGFYEFTDPTDKPQTPLHTCIFTNKADPWFCIVGGST